MKTRNIFAALAATLLLGGCFQDVHEINPGKNVGYVVPELQWANPALAGTGIHDLLVVVNGESEAYTKHYTNVRDLAREPLEVPAGESSVMVLANATEADGFQVSGLPATKFTMAEMMLWVPMVSPAQNCYAATSPVKLKSGQLLCPPMPLQPVLPSLTMSLSNIPDEFKVLVVQGDVADHVRLVEQDGRVGVASTEQGDDRVLGLVDGTPRSVLTLPTVAGKTENTITFEVFAPETPAGNATVRPRQGMVDYALILAFVVQVAKPLECGMTYKMDLDFNTMIPKMYLDSYTISDWEVGFTYNGRVY
ncbi:MAG: hypothetical protein IKP15_00360 [Bacteroidales bacterium]|nr:hypothetical protein [Bacteroidales bacterium]